MQDRNISAVAAAVADQCGNVVSAAVNAENTARDKWSKAGKALYKAGARVEALTRGTKDEPNPAQDDSLISAVESMIIDALTASVKPMRFDGGTYTVGALLSMTRDELRDADNKVLSQTRRMWQQQVGSLFGLVRRYVDKVQNPDKARGVKAKTKTDAPAEVDAVMYIRGLIAKKSTIVDIADVDRFENALTEALACLTRKR